MKNDYAYLFSKHHTSDNMRSYKMAKAVLVLNFADKVDNSHHFAQF